MVHKTKNFPTLLLGTAMWGWTVERKTAFTLLDYFYENGFRGVDAATNYPINKNSTDFRASENILLEWVNANGINDLEVIMKIGSINNLFTPEHNLSKSFLLMNSDNYLARFGNNLDTIMLHWDNRIEESEIEKSYEALQIIQQKGLSLGLSGIKKPEIHSSVNQHFNFDFKIEIKHNLFYSDYSRYKSFHGKQRFIAYGINSGGVKLDMKYDTSSSLSLRNKTTIINEEKIKKVKEKIAKANKNRNRPKIETFNQLGMIHSFHQKDMLGILLGTSKINQLESSIQFWKEMQNFDYSDAIEG